MFQDSSAHFMMTIDNIAFMLLIFASITAKHITSMLLVNASACIDHFEDGKSWKPLCLFVTDYSCNQLFVPITMKHYEQFLKLSAKPSGVWCKNKQDQIVLWWWGGVAQWVQGAVPGEASWHGQQPSPYSRSSALGRRCVEGGSVLIAECLQLGGGITVNRQKLSKQSNVH